MSILENGHNTQITSPNLPTIFKSKPKEAFEGQTFKLLA